MPWLEPGTGMIALADQKFCRPDCGQPATTPHCILPPHRCAEAWHGILTELPDQLVSPLVDRRFALQQTGQPGDNGIFTNSTDGRSAVCGAAVHTGRRSERDWHACNFYNLIDGRCRGRA